MEQRLISISGKIARVNPYSEKRRKALLEVADEIEEYLNKQEKIEPEKRAEFWKRKAEILFDFFEGAPDISFYTSEDFEVGMLAWAEQDFIRQRLYL